ncbi:MAG: efflux RND transporter permease subunit [Lachnospiraceae bacterium]|nr:efflux RND transporter permease subunit [Lachnospiraceae bacterium]
MSKYSVKKPFTVLVGVVLIIVLGVVSVMRMTTDLLPDMNLPYVMVITVYPGGSPEEVERNVTAPVEAQMATTKNIKTIQSMSYNSYSLVILEYEQSSNMDSIVIEIQQKLDQVSGSFPANVQNPMIMQLDPTMLPVMVASVDMEGMSQIEISDYVDSTIVPYLESVEGVASVSTTGKVEERIQITLDEDKIEKLNKDVVKNIEKGFADAQSEIDDAKQKIEDGEKALEDGKKQMASQVADGANQIVNGKIQLYVGESTLESNLAMMKMVKPLLERAVNAMNDYNRRVDELRQKLDLIQQYEDLLNNASDEEIFTSTGLTREQLVQLVETLKAARDAVTPSQEEVDAAINALKEAGIDLSWLGITASTDNPQTLSVQLTEALAKVNSTIATMEQAREPIAEGKVTLDDAYKKLNEGIVTGILEMSRATTEIANGKAALEQGQAQLDAAKEEALKQADISNIVTVEMLGNLILAQDFHMPAGYIDEGAKQYMISVGDSVNTVDELRDMVLLDLGMEDIEPIRVKDVAKVEVVNNAADSYSKINGNPAVMLSFEKQTGYSTGDVTDRLLDKFDQMEEEFPGLNLAVLMNQGVYIDIVVSSVVQNMLIGAALAVIILILFLKDFKSTFIIACSIPLSVIFAVVLMYFTHITLNIISLSGLALGIGMLVDNSIVVIENIYRLRKEGASINKAAVEGAKGVGGAIVSSTLTTVSVFAPIVFAQGITKQVFVDMALTVTYTLAASLIVALTFVPSLASVMIKDGEEKPTKFFDKIRDAYGSGLKYILKFKPLVLLLALVLLGVSIYAGFSRGFSFLDMDIEVDQISMSVYAPEDEEYTQEDLMADCDIVTERVMGIEGIDTVGAMVGGGSVIAGLGLGGGNSATYYLLLDENNKRKMEDITAEIIEKTKDLNCKVSVSTTSGDMTSLMGSGLSVMVKGRDLDQIREYTKEVVSIMEETPGVKNINDGLDNTTPCIKIHVDKVRAMEYQMTTAQVFAEVMKAMMPSTATTSLSADTKDYDIYVIAEEQADTTLHDICYLEFPYTDREGNHKMIPLSKVASFEVTDTLNVINRDAQTKYISVSAGIDDEHNITFVSNELQRRFDEMNLKDGYSIEMGGEDEMIRDAMKQLTLMLILAVIFIYLIMVAQFQSLLSPFIIMFTIPLAFTGGLFALFFTKNNVSVIGALGFVMLAGIIVNNGIVMVDFINQLRREGVSKKDAIVEAAKARLRPILMTTLTTVISMTTLALGIGGGSAMMQPMAIVMIGGLIYGTILTLIVVPCLYDIFNSNKSMRVDEYGERIKDEEETSMPEPVVVTAENDKAVDEKELRNAY